MLRAVALAARLGFTIDRDTAEAIRSLRGEIVQEQPRPRARGALQDPAPGRLAQDLRDAARRSASSPTCCPRPTEAIAERRRAPAGQPRAARRLPQRGPGRARGPDEPAADGHAAGAAGRAAAARGRGAGPRREPSAEPGRAGGAEPAADERRHARGDGRGAGELGAEDEERAAAGRAARRCRCRSRGATSTGCGSSWPRRAGCARSHRSPAREADARRPRLPRGRAALDGDPRRRPRARSWPRTGAASTRLRRRARARGRTRRPSRAEARPRRGNGDRRRRRRRRRRRPPPIPAAGRPPAPRDGGCDAWPALTTTSRTSGSPLSRAGSSAGSAIRRQYTLPGLQEARWPSSTAWPPLAEELDHHPDILIQYAQVTLTLTSHDAGGLTERDFRLAEPIDA